MSAMGRPCGGRFNPIKTGECKSYQADTKIYFLVGKQTSNTTKLLDFLHFNLTNPMVPNLTHVFLSDWVSGTVLREVY